MTVSPLVTRELRVRGEGETIPSSMRSCALGGGIEPLLHDV